MTSGNRTEVTAESTYEGVVSSKTVSIEMTYEALNGLCILAAEIKNSYLTAPTTEKNFIVCVGLSLDQIILEVRKSSRGPYMG